MSRNLNSSQFEEVRMFDPGPETDPETYYHFSSEGKDWNPRPQAMHLGTPKAAMDRATNVRRHSRDHEGSDRSGKVHVARLRAPMMNTPDMPISDPMANVLSDRSADMDDWYSAGNELMENGLIPFEEGDDPAEAQWVAEDQLSAEGERFRSQERGAYYENMHEDQESVSVVVNRPDRDLQHLGTVGYEPEFPSRVKTTAPNPITGEDTAAEDLYISRGTGTRLGTYLGPQFDWKQTRMPTR